MRSGMIIAIGLLATGCVTVESTFQDSVSSEGVFFFEGTTDRGLIVYDGSAIDESFDIRGRSWATGGGRSRAQRRADNNDFVVSVEGEALIASAVSRDSRAGVDFDVLGPGFMNVDILSDRGTAELYDVEGTHVVTANRVFGRNIVGDVDFFADSSGIDVEVLPYENGLVIVESRSGDVDLYLPWGLDYDINIIADPDYEIIIEDLGFDTLVLEPGLAIAWRGFRTIRVDVFVRGGDVRLYSAF